MRSLGHCLEVVGLLVGVCQRTANQARSSGRATCIRDCQEELLYSSVYGEVGENVGVVGGNRCVWRGDAGTRSIMLCTEATKKQERAITLTW